MNDIFHVVNRNTQDITSLHDNKTTVIRTIDDMNGTEIQKALIEGDKPVNLEDMQIVTKGFKSDHVGPPIKMSDIATFINDSTALSGGAMNIITKRDLDADLTKLKNMTISRMANLDDIALNKQMAEDSKFVTDGFLNDLPLQTPPLNMSIIKKKIIDDTPISGFQVQHALQSEFDIDISCLDTTGMGIEKAVLRNIEANRLNIENHMKIVKMFTVEDDTKGVIDITKISTNQGKYFYDGDGLPKQNGVILTDKYEILIKISDEQYQVVNTSIDGLQWDDIIYFKNGAFYKRISSFMESTSNFRYWKPVSISQDNEGQTTIPVTQDMPKAKDGATYKVTKNTTGSINAFETTVAGMHTTNMFTKYKNVVINGIRQGCLIGDEISNVNVQLDGFLYIMPKCENISIKGNGYIHMGANCGVLNGRVDIYVNGSTNGSTNGDKDILIGQNVATNSGVLYINSQNKKLLIKDFSIYNSQCTLNLTNSDLEIGVNSLRNGCITNIQQDTNNPSSPQSPAQAIQIGDNINQYNSIKIEQISSNKGMIYIFEKNTGEKGEIDILQNDVSGGVIRVGNVSYVKIINSNFFFNSADCNIRSINLYKSNVTVTPVGNASLSMVDINSVNSQNIVFKCSNAVVLKGTINLVDALGTFDMEIQQNREYNNANTLLCGKLEIQLVPWDNLTKNLQYSAIVSPYGSNGSGMDAGAIIKELDKNGQVDLRQFKWDVPDDEIKISEIKKKLDEEPAEVNKSDILKKLNDGTKPPGTDVPLNLYDMEKVTKGFENDIVGDQKVKMSSVDTIIKHEELYYRIGAYPTNIKPTSGCWEKVKQTSPGEFSVINTSCADKWNDTIYFKGDKFSRRVNHDNNIDINGCDFRYYKPVCLVQDINGIISVGTGEVNGFDVNQYVDFTKNEYRNWKNIKMIKNITGSYTSLLGNVLQNINIIHRADSIVNIMTNCQNIDINNNGTVNTGQSCSDPTSKINIYNSGIVTLGTNCCSNGSQMSIYNYGDSGIVTLGTNCCSNGSQMSIYNYGSNNSITIGNSCCQFASQMSIYNYGSNNSITIGNSCCSSSQIRIYNSGTVTLGTNCCKYTSNMSIYNSIGTVTLDTQCCQTSSQISIYNYDNNSVVTIGDNCCKSGSQMSIYNNGSNSTVKLGTNCCKYGSQMSIYNYTGTIKLGNDYNYKDLLFINANTTINLAGSGRKCYINTNRAVDIKGNVDDCYILNSSNVTVEKPIRSLKVIYGNNITIDDSNPTSSYDFNNCNNMKFVNAQTLERNIFFKCINNINEVLHTYTVQEYTETTPANVLICNSNPITAVVLDDTKFGEYTNVYN